MSGLEGFETAKAAVNGTEIAYRAAGDGPPLILLHGYPQTHMCWAKVAPEFARHFRVILPDLRGYGDSAAPPDDAAHTVYSKRQMALDIVALAGALGYDRFLLLGHDRGARVAYRLALDHPEKVSKIGIIEILPTADYWAAWTAELGLKAYHWTFLAQPAPLPETLIGGDPAGYVEHTLRSWTRDGTLEAFPPDALDAYRRQALDPARIAAMCADYRAGATTDRAFDEADRKAGRKITAPLMFLCADSGFPAQIGAPADAWRHWADHVEARTCSSGHFVMEEAPDAVIETFLGFFRGSGES